MYLSAPDLRDDYSRVMRNRSPIQRGSGDKQNEPLAPGNPATLGNGTQVLCRAGRILRLNDPTAKCKA